MVFNQTIVENLLNRLVRRISVKQPVPAMQPLKSKVWLRRGVSVVLDNKDVDTFEKIVLEFLKDSDILENCTVKEVEEEVEKIISDVLTAPSSTRTRKIHSGVNAFRRAIHRQVIDHTFVIPIENLKLEKRGLTVGNVKLFNFTKSQEKKWRNKIRSILSSNPYYSSQQKDKMIKDLLKCHITPLKDKVCAEVIVKGKLRRAQEKAFREIGFALDVLKLYNYRNDDFYRRYFNIEGEVIRPIIRSILSYTPSQHRMNPSIERVGYMDSYTLDDQRIEFMKKNGLNEISSIIKKPNKSWIEKRLLSAIFWYGRAFDVPQEKVDDQWILISRKTRKKSQGWTEYYNLGFRLLNLVIALESLLIVGQEPKRSNISDRCAFILGTSYSQRSNIGNFIEGMYDKRSSLVHNGESGITSSELCRLMHRTRSVIIVLLKNKDRWGIHDQQDFLNWFEKKKFA